MGVNAINPVGRGDEDKNVYNTQTQQKRKIHIGELINGLGSYVGNLPSNFNSAFTIGKDGGEAQGAFRG